MQQDDKTQEVKRGFVHKLKHLRQLKADGHPIAREDRIQVAVLADSPNVVTGFANVCREVLSSLQETGFYDFDIVGINYDGSPHDLPFRIFPAVNALIPDPAYREPYGMQKFLDIICEGRFDIVWVLQDTFIVASGLGVKIREANDMLPPHQKFQFIYYFPIDATPKKEWVDKAVMQADIPVTYTQYAFDQVLRVYDVDEFSLLKKEDQEKNKASGDRLARDLSVVYHGVNMEDFYPLTEEETKTAREVLWGVHKDKFIFTNVNRNQPRKDIFRTMQAFKILLDRRRKAGKSEPYLYLHCSVFENGLNLIDMSEQISLVQGNEFGYPSPKMFGPASGFPIEQLNKIYNASDCVVSTSLGEGWGLSLTEAMAVKKPVIAPNHTSVPEILGKGGMVKGLDGSMQENLHAERGFIAKTKNVFVQKDDLARVRPLTDAEDMADHMEWVMDHPEEVKPVVERAYDWVKTLEWRGEEVGGKWSAIFEAAFERTLSVRAKALDDLIAAEIKEKGLSRNDKCPVCDTKIKHCRHYRP